MLLNRISKTLIVVMAWALIGALCYLSESKKHNLPGSDFPVPDSTKGKPIGWDFDKQEYGYHIPNPKAKYEITPVKDLDIEDSNIESDIYENLYYYLD